MAENGVLQQNEKQANKIVAQVMRITFFIFIIIYLLNVFNVFTVDNVVMTVSFIIGSILLLLPSLFTSILKWEKWYIKYINVFIAAVFVTLLSTTLTYHVVVLYVYPIAIAGLYFSRTLNVFGTGLTVIGVTIGQILAYSLNTVQDDNFLTFDRVIIYGIVPRSLILIAVAAIFTMLASRTATMLSDLMGAEEQERMLNKMNKMQKSALRTSDKLSDMVEELSAITDTSVESNQRIAKETENLLLNSTKNTEAAIDANERMQRINKQLVELSKMNHRTAALTDEIKENINENQNRMDEATTSMEQIHNSTNECKKIISNLGEESKEIIGIVETITNISSQTNILALNATIEAARAGEHGKGFAVVAEEIQKLAEQTKTAVENIGTIVKQVVGDTEDAVAAMENSVAFTQSGMENIQKANKSSALITSSNAELVTEIHAIDKTAVIIREDSSEIANSMVQISNNTQRNCNGIEDVTSATEENLAGTESLSELVESVKEMFEHLNEIVHE